VECRNYIRTLHKVNDTTMYVCGTNAFSPTCDYMVSWVLQTGLPDPEAVSDVPPSWFSSNAALSMFGYIVPHSSSTSLSLFPSVSVFSARPLLRGG
ncbi:unnamed protein product, partial [Tetraodon nigroviridis]